MSKRRSALTVIAASLVFLAGCDDGYLIDLSAESMPGTGTWLIDENYIQWGCPEQDCIPNLTNPEMVSVNSSGLAYLDDYDLIVGVRRGDDYLAFPHPILDWHEVINMDEYSISYCPLTGSALHVDDDRGFGVSGMLHNSNLIMYDKESNSFWPQMFLQAAAGESRGEDLALDRMVETTWGTWRRLYPDTKAVSSNTGFSRNYNSYPYGSYRTDASIYFPVKNLDSRLQAKERLVGILAGDETKAYRVADFDSSTQVIHDQLSSQNVVLFGSAEDNFAVAYISDKQFSVKSYDLDTGTILFTDNETGSDWNIFGEAVAGPLAGESLEMAKSFISYWFAWAAFYPETSIWEK